MNWGKALLKLLENLLQQGMTCHFGIRSTNMFKIYTLSFQAMVREYLFIDADAFCLIRKRPRKRVVCSRTFKGCCLLLRQTFRVRLLSADLSVLDMCSADIIADTADIAVMDGIMVCGIWCFRPRIRHKELRPGLDWKVGRRVRR